MDLSKINIPFLHDEDIRRKANHFREKNWGDKIPVDIELIVEKELKLDLIPLPGLYKITGTEAFLTGDLLEVVFDTDRPEVRIRFSIAHEIGHFVLHKEQIEKLRAKSYEEWKKIINNIPGPIWGRAEYQASEFAGRLLVPKNALIKSIKKRKLLIEQAKKIINEDSAALIEYLASNISKEFNVADKTMQIRFEREKINPFSHLS
ncbi:MAG: ImmA/IrrE family metallo-endopeptidase [Ignavibacteriaceae bacterium]|nr:ImmA/IrrE family metallo-endopeptidase [Ignavibacteriaceae bacterium]MCW8812599.1 ImmA/IrrE family metallo-endopeptidase [Chlorobium sp.]MCW8818378.1 ImmA/IrrE family metallo-endopeptidase [Ignavibacteriaceae bacterium]MCW8822932.1 ImmA/IrrE family metallo-endopeptidase [Ignavibacteriaceae bacterium]